MKLLFQRLRRKTFEINQSESHTLLRAVAEDMRCEKSVIALSEKRRYRRKQLLDHRPRIWIAESEIPTEAAVEAPPILKLWVLICIPGKQDASRIDNKFLVK